MEEKHHDNPIYGRKVFFLNPQYSLRKGVIAKLQEMEYEIYIIDDYHDAKNILRNYNDSICFINTDGILTTDQWFNYINSFQYDDSLKTIFLGIMSERMVKADREQFLLKSNIPAGLIMLKDSMDDLTEIFQGILEINGAKGRRQYVRAQCANDETALLLYTSAGKMYQFKLLDISSVGAAAVMPLQYKDLIQVNSVLRDLTINIGTKQINVTAAVYSLKPGDNFITLILLFMKGTSSHAKSIIREYIFSTLQNAVDCSIIGLSKDQTDYRLPQVPKTNNTIEEDAFLLDVDETELTDEGVTHIPPKFEGNPKDLNVTDLF